MFRLVYIALKIVFTECLNIFEIVIIDFGAVV